LDSLSAIVRGIASGHVRRFLEAQQAHWEVTGMLPRPAKLRALATVGTPLLGMEPYSTRQAGDTSDLIDGQRVPLQPLAVVTSVATGGWHGRHTQRTVLVG
jgi:hypothetical protein